MMLPSQRLSSRATYVCASCSRLTASPRYARNRLRTPTEATRSATARRSLQTSSLSSPVLRHRSNSRFENPFRNASTVTPSNRKQLRIAIIGSGPAGFYTAYRLINKLDDVVVDMYEQLPVPYGLVRFGVAPDHPDVKNCQDTFEEVAQCPRFNYIGNVRVGQDLKLSQMKPHYDAMLFSYGASEDRKLGIPGEDLKGVHSAREFVGWYNGLPQFQGLQPDLKAGEQAVVIGQGNVAMDVARMLLTPVNLLRSTDITEQALQTLSESKVRSVRVVGRRGPVQAAFTIKEARELMHIPGVSFDPIDRSFYPPDVKSLPRIQKRIAELLLKGTAGEAQDSPKRWALDFLKAPKSMEGESDHISSITLQKQRFLPNADPLSPSARVEPGEDEIVLKTDVAFRSVGYKSTALPGLSEIGVPFDTRLGIIPNDIHGRVINPSSGPGELTAGHVPGLYCAGWVKRGPTGVIASTMQDAFASADVIMQDWKSDVPFLNDDQGRSNSTGLGWAGVRNDVESKGVRPLAWKDWKVIDQAERERGRKLGKEREKFATVKEMLKVLDA